MGRQRDGSGERRTCVRARRRRPGACLHRLRLQWGLRRRGASSLRDRRRNRADERLWTEQAGRGIRGADRHARRACGPHVLDLLRGRRWRLRCDHAPTGGGRRHGGRGGRPDRIAHLRRRSGGGAAAGGRRSDQRAGAARGKPGGDQSFRAGAGRFRAAGRRSGPGAPGRQRPASAPRATAAVLGTVGRPIRRSGPDPLRPWREALAAAGCAAFRQAG